MPRVNPDYSPRASLSPVAAPVDTFTGTPENSMQQLARGLSSLNPALNNYIDDAKQVMDAEDFQKGQTSYMKAKTALKDAVNNGTIQAGYSPAFRRGYEQGQLRNMGLDYDQQLREAYSTSTAASSDDPKAYSNFVNDFTSQYMEKNKLAQNFHPLDIGAAFTPAIDQAQTSLAHFHVEQRAKTIEDNWQIGASNEISTTIDNAHANGFTAEQTGAAVKDVIAKQMSNGWHDKSDFNKNVVQLVSDKALATGNKDLLGVLDHIPTGPGSTLGKTTYARAKALETSQRIDNQVRDDQRWQWSQQDHVWSQQAHAWALQEQAHTKQDWGIEQSAGTFMRGMLAKTMTDPKYDATADTLQLNKLDRDGGHARTFMAWKNSFLNNSAQGEDHPDVVTNLYGRLVSNQLDAKQIVDAFSNHTISMNTMQKMLDDQRRQSQEGASPLLSDPIYSNWKNGVMAAFRGDPDSFDVQKQAAATRAVSDFQLHALKYIKDHRDKGDLDTDAFYAEMQKHYDRLTKPLLTPPAKANTKPGAKPNPYAATGMAH